LNLEHEKESLKHVIEISIKRKHKVGEYPLIINVSSLVADLKIDKNLDRTGLESKMKKIFESQESYNAFVSEKQFLFDKFLSMLELGVRKFIKIDNVKRSSQLNIIRPSGKKAVLEPDKSHYGTSAYFDMYNLKDYFFYTMLWSSLSFSNNLYLNNFFLVDEYGSNVMGVGSEGFHAGNSDTMNPDAAFEPPQSGDIEFYGDNQFEEELQNDGLLDGYESADYEEDSFDWMDTGDSFSDVDSGSCSSCASYSSD